MFTLNQIKEAHAKTKTGADFPQYVQDLIDLGLTGYDLFVEDGHATYYGKNNYSISSESIYDKLSISSTLNTDNFKIKLKEHQQGKTNYLTFCKECAENGIIKWTLNFQDMTCIYYNSNNMPIVTEIIPTI